MTLHWADLHPYVLSLFAMPSHKCKYTSGEPKKWGFMSANQKNTSPHCNRQMLSVLKVTPGSIRVDIPSHSSGLATDVAAKWFWLEVLINPSARHTHLCFWAHALWLSYGNLTCHPWHLEYHDPPAWVVSRTKAWAPNLIKYNHISYISAQKKVIPALLFWGSHGNKYRTTLRFRIWALLHCLWPNWIILSNLLNLSNLILIYKTEIDIHVA